MRAVVDGVRAVMVRFDPSLVTVSDAQVLVLLFDELERMGLAGKTLAARRATESPRLLRAKGFRDGADYLARTTGTTTGEASAILATAEAMGGLDATVGAFKTGQLSPRAAAAAGAARANPDAETEMLEVAATGSLRDVQERSRRVRRDASFETDEQRAARSRRCRSVRTWIDDDTGDGRGMWRLPPGEHAVLVAELNRRKDTIFRAARTSGTRDHDDAYLADALVDLAGTGTGRGGPSRADDRIVPPDCLDSSRGSSASDQCAVPGGPVGPDGSPAASTSSEASSLTGALPGPVRSRWNTKILIRVDHTALERGHTVSGEVCEIAGIGPVGVPEVRDLLGADAAKAVIAIGDDTEIRSLAHLGRDPVELTGLTLQAVEALVHSGVEIGSVVHHGRRPTTAQITVLEWISGGRCQIHACTSSTNRLEIDHVEDWAHTQHTTLDELAVLCGHHHDLKTHHHWTVGPLQPDGTRAINPPSSPPPRTPPPPDTS